MDESIKELECPFTWNINKQFVLEFRDFEETIDIVDEESVYYTVKSLMRTYILIVKGDHKGALENSLKTDLMWMKIDKQRMDSEGMSPKVLEHILHATKYYLHKTIDDSDKNLIRELQKNIQDARTFQTDKEKGTIYGLKAVAWKTLYPLGYENAIPFAEKAITLYPNCWQWHFILGQCFKYIRMIINNERKPSFAERNAFLKSFDLSTDIYIGMTVAQIHRDCYEYELAKEIYLDVYETNPNSNAVLLSLAKGLTNFCEFDKAELCFSKVKKDNDKYHHYRGLFFRKQNMWEEAAYHFKEAVDLGNYRAEFLYVQSMTKINRNFDLIGYLQSIIHKYEKYSRDQYFLQEILLHIAIQYEAENYIENSLIYYLKGIQLNPTSNQLKNFTNRISEIRNNNIFRSVELTIIRTYKASTVPLHMKNIVEELQNLCDQERKHST